MSDGFNEEETDEILAKWDKVSEQYDRQMATILQEDELRKQVHMKMLSKSNTATVFGLYTVLMIGNAVDIAIELIKERESRLILETQLGLIEYFDQTPSNELMDWKGLFADNRKEIEYQLSKLSKEESKDE